MIDVVSMRRLLGITGLSEASSECRSPTGWTYVWMFRVAMLGMLLCFLSGCSQDPAGPSTEAPALDHSGVLTWERLPGLYVGRINTIVVNRQGNMFLIARSGFYRSSDMGTTWVACSYPSDARSWLAIGADDRLYLAGPFNLYSSSDLGNTWSPISHPASQLNGIEISPQGDIYLLPGYDFTEPPIVYPPVVLYRSTDGGNTWTERTIEGDGRSKMGPMGFTRNGDVLVGMDSRLLVSRDSGDTWESLAEFNSSVRSITANVQDDLFVLLRSTDFELYRSVDGGTTWTQIHGALGEVNVVYVAPDGNLWVGTSDDLIVSDDNGITWRTVDTGFRDIRCIFVNPWGAVYCGLYEDGIIRSLNGTDWVQVGLQGLTVWAIAVDSQDNIYLGSYVSTDHGASWDEVNCPMAKSIAINSRDHVYVASGDVYLSTDRGQTWSEKRFHMASVVAVDPQDHIFLATSHNGIWRSTDDGNSWERVLGIDDWIRSLFVTRDGRIFVGTQDSTYRSVDGGESWYAIGLEEVRNVWCIAETESGVLLAGTYQRGIYRSVDGGTTWTQIEGVHGSIWSILPYRGMLLAGDARARGLYVSLDDGISWIPSGFEYMDVTSLTIGPDSNVLAGTRSGIFRGRLE